MSDEDTDRMLYEQRLAEEAEQEQAAWEACHEQRIMLDQVRELHAENAQLKAEKAKAVEALQVFADDGNWFDTPDGDGVTMNPTWRGPTFTPEQFARDVIAELTGGNDD